MLNEVRQKVFKRFVIGGITYVLLTTEGGIVNEMIASLAAGWGTILYLAAMSSIDPQLYEAVKIDGAGRFRQMWHVTLPCIRSTIIILLILQIGHFMDLGFEQIYIMLNPANKEFGDVFDTYVYVAGIQQGQFSYSTAVGLFKSIVGLILVIGANYFARKSGEEGLF